MDRHELAWAAGFFDGEGWAGRKRPRGVGAQIHQADNDGVPSALTRFQAALDGLGRIAGPVRKPDRRDLYRWVVSSKGDVQLLVQLLRPWLGSVKLLQLAAAAGDTSPPAASVQRNDDAWRAW